MQYFLGPQSFQAAPLFDAFMMGHFRKRFPVEAIAQINEFICTGKWPEEQRNARRDDVKKEEKDQDDRQEPPFSGGQGKGKNKNTSEKKLKREKKKNRGKLILDATIAPADIKYPTDTDLLNSSREHLETAIGILWAKVPHNGHKLPYSPKSTKDFFPGDQLPESVF